MTNEIIQICEKCGSLGHPVKRTKGSLGVEVALWVFFLVPGIIYSIWRRTAREATCERCDGKMIPIDTPRGQMLMFQYQHLSEPLDSFAKTAKPKSAHTYLYFFPSDGADSGPYSLSQMLAFRHSGKINSNTLVVREGDQEWRMLSEFPEFSGN